MKANTANKSGKPAAKHQRLKLAFIPLLLLVLAYVIYAPSQQDVSPTTPVAAIANRPTVTAAGLTAQATTAAKGSSSRPVWPEANLQFLASPNPFQSDVVETPQSAEQRLVSTDFQPSHETVDPLTNVATDLERRTVNFVFRSSKQNVIMLGDEVLQEGMHLSPEVQLHDIQDNTLTIKLRP